MDDDELTGLIEQARDAVNDGVRLGIGMCAMTVDQFINLAPRLTTPEHVDAVVAVLQKLAAAMRERSARLALTKDVE
jgi:hypothetical protein